MYELLKGLRVVEGSAFVAAPTCGLYLAQMGAEVIRFDNIGGGPDFRRWPLAENGASLYWEGLNKAKKSVAIDLGRPEGREIAQRLAAAPGALWGIWLALAAVERFIVEIFRAKDDRFLGVFSVAQLISVLLLAVGLAITASLLKRSAPAPRTAPA